MTQAASSVDVLGNMDNIKILSNVLKTNVAACTSIGSFFLPQIGRIFLDMLGLYKAVSGIISETVAREGKPSLHHRFGSALSVIQERSPRRPPKFGSCERRKRRS
jgi:hypothetical protein